MIALLKKVIIWPDTQPTECEIINDFTDEEGRFFIVKLPNGAKICVARRFVKLPLFWGNDAQTVYNQLGDIPINEEMEIDENFYHYHAGTSCEDIWHDMENHFNIVFGEMHRTDVLA